MPKIKIWFGITKGNWGGAQKYVYDLATHLAPEQFSVTVIAGEPGLLIDKLKAQNLPVLTLDQLGRDIHWGRDLIAGWKLFKLLKRHQPDILHLNSPKMGLLGAIAGRFAGIKKIIYTSHGWPFLENRSRISRHILRHLCQLIVLLCHETIVISQAERRRKRFHLIYNGIAPMTLWDREAARQKLVEKISEPLINHQTWLGTIAELHKNKGLEYAIAAMALVVKKQPHVVCVVIGEGEERAKLETQIAKAKLQNNFFLVGQIPNAAALLPAFDIFILSSIKEGLPYVILEAGLASLPVIATSVGGVPEVIGPEQTGRLVPPRNPRALAEAISTLIIQSYERQTFGQNLYEKVARDFTLEKMVEETKKLYLS